jgi:2-polyprenyl-6-methoxyphenol hydroxylase-like FAD-dependent oxidoreductase
MSRQATIAGAGISGLATARALLADGWDVRLFEQTPWSARGRNGIGNVARGNEGSRPARTQQTWCKPKLFANGKRASFAPTAAWSLESPPKSPCISSHVLRSSLRCVGEDWTTASNGHTTSVTRPPSQKATVVIGADGINSRIRRAMTGEHHIRRPLGSIVFRGVAPGGTSQITETWGRGRLFGITPQDSTSTNWFACVREDLLYRRGKTHGDRRCACRAVR